MRGIRGVIFDMDGTLVDSESMTRQVVDAVLDRAGYAGPPLGSDLLFGVTWQAIAGHMIQAHPPLEGLRGDDLDAEWLEQWRRDPPPPVAGVEGALAAARAAGLPLALATSSNRPAVDLLLARPGFAGAFDAIVTAEDISRSKPDPEIFRLAAERIGVPPEHCVVFEDSLAGLCGAMAAGTWRVAVLLRSTDPARADDLAHESIEDYTELPATFFADAAR